jgi:hypothetical protein
VVCIVKYSRTGERLRRLVGDVPAAPVAARVTVGGSGRDADRHPV